jgi:hypothetical protein
LKEKFGKFELSKEQVKKVKGGSAPGCVVTTCAENLDALGGIRCYTFEVECEY